MSELGLPAGKVCLSLMEQVCPSWSRFVTHGAGLSLMEQVCHSWSRFVPHGAGLSLMEQVCHSWSRFVTHGAGLSLMEQVCHSWSRFVTHGAGLSLMEQVCHSWSRFVTHGAGLSLMERLKNTSEVYASNDPNYTLMLRNNFRSDPAVLRIPNDLFYHGQLRVCHSWSRFVTHGAGLSLMERLKNTSEVYASNDPNYTLMLRNNFRSDPAVLRIPNDLFYHGQLRALAAVDPLSSADILGERAQSRAIVFHGVLSKEQRMGKSPSYFNNTELEIVQKYIKALITKHNVRPADIGVVTPYIRQVYKIKTWLHSTLWSGLIEVGTVEAFQGKEKRVIIISTVRANCSLLAHDAKYQLGFLVDDKRFNVALTRAKAKAIVIGNPLCLEKDIKWRTYMQHCREYGTFFGYDCAQEGNKKDIVDRITPILNELKVKDAKVKRRR
ncbi:AAA domain-containing protein [Phthorimaea operculella]|nr:AAA domain-containing protein [Phthorimaea operculella]